MRVSERNYPILKYLKFHQPLNKHPEFTTSKFGMFHVPNSVIDTPVKEEKMRQQLQPIVDDWKELSETFSEHIDIVSVPFMEAACVNMRKIWTVETEKDVFQEPLCGTILMGDKSFCYWVELKDGVFQGNMMVHQGEHLLYLMYDDVCFVHPAGLEEQPEGGATMKDSFECVPILFHLFKKYADVETVQAMKNKKVKLPDGDKLLVESDLRMTYTDCSWFRTIVRKEGFLVSGHFRLQPIKKDGEWTKKLIYIEPYQKHGYTRKARINKTLPVVN